jgi:hypothetical protein
LAEKRSVGIENLIGKTVKIETAGTEIETSQLRGERIEYRIGPLIHGEIAEGTNNEPSAGSSRELMIETTSRSIPAPL